MKVWQLIREVNDASLGASGTPVLVVDSNQKRLSIVRIDYVPEVGAVVIETKEGE